MAIFLCIRIPGTNVSFVMVPIEGGKFMMGSSETEPGRHADEGPLHKVKWSPFWTQQCEVTWDEYEPFKEMYDYWNSGLERD